MIYLDTSAIVKLVHREPESTALREFIDHHSGGPLLSSLVARVETERALRRIDPPALPHVPLVLGGVNMVLIGESICAAAGAYADPSLRSLDAIHLATAALLGPSLVALVTYDKRMASAAEAVGLPVAAPG